VGAAADGSPETASMQWRVLGFDQRYALDPFGMRQRRPDRRRQLMAGAVGIRAREMRAGRHATGIGQTCHLALLRRLFGLLGWLLDRGQVRHLVRRDVEPGIVDTAKSEAGTLHFRPPRTAHDPSQFEPSATPEMVRDLGLDDHRGSHVKFAAAIGATWPRPPW